MIFRQMFDNVSSAYTYLMANRHGGEALIIDPVYERVEHYLKLLEELDLKLAKAVDTHVHADHITGLGALRYRTKCITVMGRSSSVDVVSMRVDDGDTIEVEGIRLEVIYTPGHTDDSYCFRAADRVFTGDTLLIRGTGRTDFQNGDPAKAYRSLFEKLLTLPDDTLVFPGHDYKGDTVSTIGEERAHNPRLQVQSAEEYVELMNGLNLANPKMMDVAVPANQRIGVQQTAEGGETWSVAAGEALSDADTPDVLLVDLRDTSERRRDGIIPGSVHVPYTDIAPAVRPGGLIHYEAVQGSKRIMYYCAFGERSALAVQTSRDAGLFNVCHIVGGIDAWKEAGGDIDVVASLT
ncbi:MAG: MBL fold metallo-hydrolase [Proteobacteria bacterium]|nr:MBL fold metallo-hydrolase [Pseudomonadota bacterium]